jgi:DNA invertase Pin-like site-specific DNA recombinase
VQENGEPDQAPQDRSKRSYSAKRSSANDSFNSTTTSYDTLGPGRDEADSSTGSIVTAVEGLAAEHYRRVISEKTRDALARLRLQGRRTSGLAPHGCRFGPGGRLVTDPREQDTLAEIRALAGAGLSLRGISRALAGR